MWVTIWKKSANIKDLHEKWKLPQILDFWIGSDIDMYMTLWGLVFFKNEMDEKVLAKIIFHSVNCVFFYLLHYFEKITAKY